MEDYSERFDEVERNSVRYLERYDKAKKNLARYFLISEYYVKNPERISANQKNICDILSDAVESHVNLRVGSEKKLHKLMENFGVQMMKDDSSGFYLVFKPAVEK